MKAQTIYERLATDAQSVTRGEIKLEILRLYQIKDEYGMKKLFNSLVRGMPKSPYDGQIATPEARLNTAIDSLDFICAMADLHLKGEPLTPSTLTIWNDRMLWNDVREFYWKSIAEKIKFGNPKP